MEPLRSDIVEQSEFCELCVIHRMPPPYSPPILAPHPPELTKLCGKSREKAPSPRNSVNPIFLRKVCRKFVQLGGPGVRIWQLQGGSGSVRFGYGSRMERFERFRFPVLTVLWGEVRCVSAQFEVLVSVIEKTVPAGPVPILAHGKRFRRCLFPVPVRFLCHPAVTSWYNLYASPRVCSSSWAGRHGEVWPNLGLEKVDPQMYKCTSSVLMASGLRHVGRQPGAGQERRAYHRWVWSHTTE